MRTPLGLPSRARREARAMNHDQSPTRTPATYVIPAQAGNQRTHDCDAQQGDTSKSAMPLLLTQEPVKAYYLMQYMKMDSQW
jgi:hypothetical protein